MSTNSQYLFDESMEEQRPLLQELSKSHPPASAPPSRHLVSSVTGSFEAGTPNDVAFRGRSLRNPAFTLSTESRLVVEHSTTATQTFMHILKGNVGTGLLGLPFAVYNAGILIGPLGLAGMGVIALTCMTIMVNICHYLCEKTNSITLDYGEVADQALKHGPIGWLRRHYTIGGYVVNAFLVFTQLGFCCVYFLFMADNVRQIYCHYYGSGTPSIQIFILMLLPLVLIYCYIRNLADLAIFSTFANILTIASILIIYEYLVSHIGMDTHPKDLPLANNLNGFFIFFGTAIYAYEGIGVVLPLENKMKNPQNFTRVMLSAMLIVVLLYVSMGVLGYLCFGKLTAETITLNLPNTGLYLAVRVMLVAAIFVTYGVQFYVPITVMWPFFMQRTPQRFHLPGELLFRTLLVILTMVLAIVVPHLGLFIAFVGAFSSSTLAIIFPPFLQELVYFEKGFRSTGNFLRLIRNIVIMLVGIVGFGFGTYVSLMEIIKSMQESEHDHCSEL